MKKKLIAAAAFAAVAAFVSVNAFSESNKTDNIHVSGSVANVTSDDAGVAIIASYDNNKRLNYVKLTDVPAGSTKQISISNGDKIMLWNKLGANGMKPAVSPIQMDDVQPTAIPKQ